MSAIYGHRGARGERPENTIEAFLYARTLGIDGIECDVALTKDFAPVIHHDPQLANGTLIRDLTLQQLHEASPSIPTLAQALAAVPDTEWLIEIKTFPGSQQKTFAPEIMAKAVIAVVDAAGMADRACIMAFDWRVLAAVARLSGIRRICLTAPETERAKAIWWGKMRPAETMPEAVARTGAQGWAAFHETLTPEQIRQAHRLGLKVFAWTVNTTAEYQRLTVLIDGVITDFPSLSFIDLQRERENE